MPTPSCIVLICTDICQNIPSILVLYTRSLSQVQLQSLFYSALSYIILNFTCQDIAASLILLIHFFISSAHLHGVVRFYSALNRCFPFCILSLERRVWVRDYPRSQDYWLQFLIALRFVKTKNALLHID